MAQRAVEAILQAFQHGWDQVRQQKQFEDTKKLQEQQEEDLRNYRQSELAHQQAQLDAQVAQTKAQQAANEKLFNLQMLPVTQQISEQYGRTGALPAGASVTPDFVQNVPLPQIQGGPLSQIPQPQQPPSFQTGTIQLPFGLGTIQGAQSPEAYAQRQRILNAPAEEAKTREAEALQAAETTRMLQVAALEHTNRMDELKSSQTAASSLEDKRNANALQIARIRSTANAFGDIADIPGLEDTLNAGAMGALSAEDLKKRYSAKQVAQLNEFAGQSGNQFLPKTKVDQIQALETMGDLIPHIRNMLNLRYAHPLQVNNPLSEIGQEFEAEAKKIRESAPQASVAVSGVRRFSGEELNRFDQYFIPKTMPLVSSPEANLINLNSFTDDLQQSLKRVLKGINPIQQKTIIDNLVSKGLKYNPQLTPQEMPSGKNQLTGPEPILIPGQPLQVPAGKTIRWRLNPQSKQLEQIPEGQ